MSSECGEISLKLSPRLRGPDGLGDICSIPGHISSAFLPALLQTKIAVSVVFPLKTEHMFWKTACHGLLELNMCEYL